jgi:hypothetical protein
MLPRDENVVAIDLITEHIRMKLQQPDLRRIYPNLEVIPSNFQIRGMHTIIRDATTPTPDFVFYADRLLRLVCPSYSLFFRNQDCFRGRKAGIAGSWQAGIRTAHTQIFWWSAGRCLTWNSIGKALENDGWRRGYSFSCNCFRL